MRDMSTDGSPEHPPASLAPVVDGAREGGCTQQGQLGQGGMNQGEMSQGEPRHPSVWQNLPMPVRPTALHMLRHPDRRTTWAVAGVIRFESPLGGGDPAKVASVVEERFAELHRLFPVVGARLSGTQWVPGRTNPVVFSSNGSAVTQAPVRPFDLSREAPFRLFADAGGWWLTLVSHHAAIDGANMTPMLKLLCGDPPGAPERSRPLARRAVPPWQALWRLARPADPVAPSAETPEGDTFAHVPLPPIGKDASTRLPEALALALMERNERMGKPIGKLGLSISVVEVDAGLAVASYRRIDIPAGRPIRPAVEAALRSVEEPWEILHAPRALKLLAPLAGRLSDTLLLSNFGRIQLSGVRSLEIYPVARGRSAVAFGAVRVVAAESTLTIRARHLSPSDAASVLARAVELLASGT
jgi:hypothetical protein